MFKLKYSMGGVKFILESTDLHMIRDFGIQQEIVHADVTVVVCECGCHWDCYCQPKLAACFRDSKFYYALADSRYLRDFLVRWGQEEEEAKVQEPEQMLMRRLEQERWRRGRWVMRQLHPGAKAVYKREEKRKSRRDARLLIQEQMQ